MALVAWIAHLALSAIQRAVRLHRALFARRVHSIYSPKATPASHARRALTIRPSAAPHFRRASIAQRGLTIRPAAAPRYCPALHVHRALTARSKAAPHYLRASLALWALTTRPSAAPRHCPASLVLWALTIRHPVKSLAQLARRALTIRSPAVPHYWRASPAQRALTTCPTAARRYCPASHVHRALTVRPPVESPVQLAHLELTVRPSAVPHCRRAYHALRGLTIRPAAARRHCPVSPALWALTVLPPVKSPAQLAQLELTVRPPALPHYRRASHAQRERTTRTMAALRRRPVSRAHPGHSILPPEARFAPFAIKGPTIRL
jgi:hypothetical protein